MRLRQLWVVFILKDLNKLNHIVAYLCTGYGASHIMKVFGVYKTWFTFIFILLLTLSANVLAKFVSASQQHGKV
jgi:hypothetical protein